MPDIRAFIAGFVLAFSLIACAATAYAQNRPSDAPETVLPDALTQAAIRNVLSELDDRQVRALLLERLTAEAERQAAALAARDERTLGDFLATGAGNFGTFLADVIVKVPNLPGEIQAAFVTFAERRGDTPLWHFFVTLGVALGLGAGAAVLFARWRPPSGNTETVLHGSELLRHVRILAIRFGLQILVVAVFAFCALAINAWINADKPTDRETIARVVTALTWVWLTLIVARFLFAPSRPDLRLVAIGDADARWLTGRAVIVGAVFMLGFGFTGWLDAMGSLYVDSWHGFWVNTAGHVVLGVVLWQARFILRRILSGEAVGTSEEPALYRAWPAIAVGLVALNWLIIEIVVANAYVPDDLFSAIATTLILLVVLPFLDQMLGAVVRILVAGDENASDVLKAAREQTRRGTLRIARVVGAIVLLLVILEAWDVDLVTLAERGIGAAFAADLVGALLIIGVAYVAWEAIRVVIARQIAMERVRLGLGIPSDDAPEGEGGGTGARLGTLLPLVRVSATVAIVVMAVLTLLGQFGVNVLPLVAGAGVVGLAIGFGAQTLVRDIVSGIFFLIDDAFRTGEYIDVGDTKGTVERISVRSMQLRHHRGTLNTVPFGEITRVSNLSRDWVIMKFPLRLHYGTDTEKVRKMIKKLGEELLDHPEYGHQFLQPLKSQGVVEMEDSYMIVPVKFMSRPGEQWMLRRLVLTKIHELFEKNKIRFASREVTVRLGDDHPTAELSPADREAVAGAAGRLIHQEEGSTAGADR